MADGLNKVMLIGNLGQTPELRFTQGGQPVLSLRMATNESYVDRNGDRQERTEWHAIVIWGKRGEALNKILGKGSQVYVEGRLQTRAWEDRQGQKRYTTEVVARDVILLGGRGRGPSVGDDRPPPPDDSFAEARDYGGGGGSGIDDGYSGGGGGGGAGGGGGGGGAGGGGGGDFTDDDIPF